MAEIVGPLPMTGICNLHTYVNITDSRSKSLHMCETHGSSP